MFFRPGYLTPGYTILDILGAVWNTSGDMRNPARIHETFRNPRNTFTAFGEILELHILASKLFHSPRQCCGSRPFDTDTDP